MKSKAQCENAIEIFSNDHSQILEQVLPVQNALPLSLGQAQGTNFQGGTDIAFRVSFSDKQQRRGGEGNCCRWTVSSEARRAPTKGAVSGCNSHSTYLALSDLPCCMGTVTKLEFLHFNPSLAREDNFPFAWGAIKPWESPEVCRSFYRGFSVTKGYWHRLDQPALCVGQTCPRVCTTPSQAAGIWIVL